MAKRKYKVGDMFMNNHYVIWQIAEITVDKVNNTVYKMQCCHFGHEELFFTVYPDDIKNALKNKVWTPCTKAAKILFWKEPKSGKKKKSKPPFNPEYKYSTGTYIILEIQNWDRTNGTHRMYTTNEVFKIIEHTWYSRSDIRYVCQTQNGDYREVDKKYLEDKAIVGNRKSLEALFGIRK